MLQRIGCSFEVLADGDQVAPRLIEGSQIPPPVSRKGSTLPPIGGASSGGSSTGKGASAPPFDLVFMDILMQRANGDDTCRALVAAGLSIPVFAMTANADFPGARTHCE